MAQMMYYRYVDAVEENLIRTQKQIAPHPQSGCKYYTPDRYGAAADAQRFLALAYLPAFRVGPIPADELDFDIQQLAVVAPAAGQPGGGLEAATSKTVYLFDIAQI